MARRFATTSKKFRIGDPIPDPVPPPGSGWSLRGSSSIPSQSTGEITLQWSWENTSLLNDQEDSGDQVLTQETIAQR